MVVLSVGRGVEKQSSDMPTSPRPGNHEVPWVIQKHAQFNRALGCGLGPSLYKQKGPPFWLKSSPWREGRIVDPTKLHQLPYGKTRD